MSGQRASRGDFETTNVLGFLSWVREGPREFYQASLQISEGFVYRCSSARHSQFHIGRIDPIRSHVDGLRQGQGRVKCRGDRITLT